MAKVVKTLLGRWNDYKYRFLPWIAFNMKNRSVRAVPHASLDKLLPDATVEKSLLVFCTALERSQTIENFSASSAKPFAQEIQTEHEAQLCEACEIKRTNLLAEQEIEHLGLQHRNVASYDTIVAHCGCILPYHLNTDARTPLDVMHSVLGFTIERAPSRIAGGGTGVVVTRGVVPKGCVLALYPGTVYAVHEPILIQSLGNQFIFRCLDGILIDGNDRGISKMIYKSCSQRERIGPYMTSDMTWFSDDRVNPMAVGQYINNHTKDCAANVDYQEFDVPLSFPLNLRKYLPNVFYSTEHQYAGEDYESRRWLRTVVLVSVREIQEGEELLSSYFTTVVQ
ncbi:SET domain-containing protein 9-like [Amphiura filiformis]|uniref:SET domain-containing protein 9-like n=1 Tax=Amphiura filiformis TaxID=82378 RepID=UPI003B21A96D